jgi:DNA-binding NarL/FixJ family response regulator
VNRVSVLLVDDSAVFLGAAGQFLQEHYAEEVNVVGTACGGDQAIVRAEALRPHVIVLDLRMPGMTGLEVVPWLRTLLPAVRIIMLTQLDGRGYREAALAAGADEFVSKASMDTDLLPAIRRVTRDLGGPDHPD